MLHAIAIGIDRYSDPRIRDLACARSDAHTFGTLLSERITPAERREPRRLGRDQPGRARRRLRERRIETGQRVTFVRQDEPQQLLPRQGRRRHRRRREHGIDTDRWHTRA